jgi:predicted kinase
MKNLILLRGLPGSGKSTLAKTFQGAAHFEADMYFVDDAGNYNFDRSKIRLAHEWCQRNVELAMSINEKDVVVSNTFTQEWEMEAYNEMAAENGYRVMSLIVENRHNGVNEHDCPADTIEIMRNRFDIKL